jgi:hypothetical protein
MRYELMDVDTANVVGVYETEAEALAEVRSLLRANGSSFAEALALGYADEAGQGDLIARGSDLAARAAATERERRSA